MSNRMGTVLKFPEEPVRKKGKSKVAAEPNADVLDMTERRDAILMEERRKVKRTLLTEFLGASVVIPGKGLERVALHDISDSGLSFDMSSAIGYFRPGDEIAVRIYLNHKTYFAFFARVANVREFNEEQVFRHGCGFVPGTINQVALQHFVHFLESVSASLKTDQGDILVSNIR